MKKVKNILFRMNVAGQGIVNNDSNDQKWTLFQMKGMDNLKERYGNVMFAKKNFYKDAEGNISYRLKISSDCLKHEIFRGDMFAQSPNICHDPNLLCSFIASPAGLVRGYMFTEGKESLKRKSALSITDAEQTNDALSYVETCSRSGEKTSDDTVGDTTFFKKETVGQTTYFSQGSIDLKQLQFVSADSLFDRYALNPDDFKTYKDFLRLRMPSFDGQLGYYMMAGTSVKLAEYGVKLSNEDVVFLVNDILRRLKTLNIQKSGAFARASKVEFKLVYDPLVDTFENEDGWTEVSSKPISFEVEEFYLLQDEKEAKAIREQVVKNRAEAVGQRKADKAEKAEKAKDAKDAKKKAKEEVKRTEKEEAIA